jgi:hypothetical protein
VLDHLITSIHRVNMSVYETARGKRVNAPEWKKQLTRELLKPKPSIFPRRRIFSPNVDSMWTMDLLDTQKLS